MRASPLLLALWLVALPAWADPETSHPMTDRPFPALEGLHPRPPFALLFWQKTDARALRRMGEAKLVELAAASPGLSVHSVEVAVVPQLTERPYGPGIVRTASLAPAQFARLGSRTPVILTVDRQDRIHRVSQIDHWPALSVLDARFGLPVTPPPSWHERLGAWLRNSKRP